MADNPNQDQVDELAELEERLETIAGMETPVLQLWEGILAVPIIGPVDTARAQSINETLLEQITSTHSETVILDITGVPVVDTAVAQHLLETVTAGRLLGADVYIVGLSAKTAMTLVALGLDLSDVTTRPTLSRGLALAFERQGLRVGKIADSLEAAPLTMTRS